MKILELTTYSAGICGVGARVLQESQLLAKNGHEVQIFSTNFTKGSEEIAPAEDKISNIQIRRFPGTKLGGESFTYWEFEAAALEFKPDVIIAHAYRHTHTLKAAKLAKKLGIRAYLVTHAPFVPGNNTRSFIAKSAVRFYDSFIGPNVLKKFDKVIAITKWEMPFLKQLGVPSNKIAYIPNGIPSELFTEKKQKSKNTILFVGRISPIKDLETLIAAFHKSNLSDIKLEIVGPAEKEYLYKLENMIAEHNISGIIFSPAIYDKRELARKIDEASVFVLPSKREAMPQSLIEAMARGKVVIASDNLGTRDLIKNGKNGFLFPVGDSDVLADLLRKTTSRQFPRLEKSAKKSVEQFKWDSIINKLEKFISLGS